MKFTSQRVLQWAAAVCGILSAAAFAWWGAMRWLLHMALEGKTFSLGGSTASSIAVIGGADGPTSIFIAGTFGGINLGLWAGVLLALAAGVLLLIRRKRR